MFHITLDSLTQGSESSSVDSGAPPGSGSDKTTNSDKSDEANLVAKAIEEAFGDSNSRGIKKWASSLTLKKKGKNLRADLKRRPTVDEKEITESLMPDLGGSDSCSALDGNNNAKSIPASRLHRPSMIQATTAAEDSTEQPPEPIFKFRRGTLTRTLTDPGSSEAEGSPESRSPDILYGSRRRKLLVSSNTGRSGEQSPDSFRSPRNLSSTEGEASPSAVKSSRSSPSLLLFYEPSATPSKDEELKEIVIPISYFIRIHVSPTNPSHLDIVWKDFRKVLHRSLVNILNYFRLNYNFCRKMWQFLS